MLHDYSTCSTNGGRGCSKAQACLKKILHIISSIPPPSLNESNRGFDIDLNKCLFWESGESESLDLSACSFVGKEIKSDVSGNEERITEGSSSDITNLQETTEFGQESKTIKEEDEDEDGVQTGPFRAKEQNVPNNDCLGLLIAAAELISSTEFECPSRDKELTQTHHLINEKKTRTKTESTTSVSKRASDRWTVVLEDTSPVVRSKRGRNQVLPYRYRDSILLLEPCKRRPPKRSSTSTVVSTKRQSR